MKEFFGATIEVQLYPLNAKERESYGIGNTTAVFLDDEMVPLEIALNEKKLRTLLEERLEHCQRGEA